MTDKMRNFTLILVSVLLAQTLIASAMSPLAVGDFILRSCVSSVVLRNYRKIPVLSSPPVNPEVQISAKTPRRPVPTLENVERSVRGRQEAKISVETPVWTLNIKKDRKSQPASFVRKNLYLEPPPGGSYSPVKSKSPEIFVIKSLNSNKS